MIVTARLIASVAALALAACSSPADVQFTANDGPPSAAERSAFHRDMSEVIGRCPASVLQANPGAGELVARTYCECAFGHMADNGTRNELYAIARAHGGQSKNMAAVAANNRAMSRLGPKAQAACIKPAIQNAPTLGGFLS